MPAKTHLTLATPGAQRYSSIVASCSQTSVRYRTRLSVRRTSPSVAEQSQLANLPTQVERTGRRNRHMTQRTSLGTHSHTTLASVSTLKSNATHHRTCEYL